MILRTLRTALALSILSLATVAQAQEIRIGLTGTFTGPNASNGLPYRAASELFPTTMAGVPVKWIVLDDGGAATTAMKNARRFVDVDKVDAIVGSTSTPTAMTLFDLANASKTLQLAMSPVDIPEAKREWVFSIPQPASLMVSALVTDMKQRGIKTVAFLGFNDGWGDVNWNALNAMAGAAGIRIVANERYARTDPSVTAQVLKILAANPQAVFIGASTTPAVLPHVTLKDQGFNGPIYHTHGVAGGAFLSAGGKQVEGALLPAGPIVVTDDLPDSNPISKVTRDFVTQYQARHGNAKVTAFAGYAWDAMLLLDAAATRAIGTAKPGTPEFRAALRAQMEAGQSVVGTNAVYTFTPTDHYGVDERARVLVSVRNGAFRLADKPADK